MPRIFIRIWTNFIGGMTELKEIEVLVARGLYEDALGKVHELKDPLDKVRVLTSIALALHHENGDEEWIETLLEDARYLASRIRNPGDAVAAHGLIASTYGAVGREAEALELFEEGIDMAGEIGNPILRSRALANLAYYLAIAGFVTSALDVFEIAFDGIVRAEAEYTLKVDYLIEIAELLEKAGDRLNSKEALPFYRRAYDIFEKLHVGQKAILLEKKAKLASMLVHAGSPEIRRALFEGNDLRAVSMASMMYSGPSRVIGLLEVALWIKKMEGKEYHEVIEKALGEGGNVRLSEAHIHYIAKLLTELGSLEKALAFAGMIEDVRERSEALGALAVALARGGRFNAAHRVAGEIPDEELRQRIMDEIATMEEA
ncbi:hypothetical protein JCM16138_22950 [Thermococcus atlanticus]